MGAAADATEARFRSLAVIGSGLLVAGLLVVAGASAKMAADFQQAVNRLRTGAGDTQDSFNSLASGILKVSVATGIMTGPLNQAMYLILSSGQRGAQAMDTLKVAAEGATIEQAKVVDVANVVSGVMTNYGTKVYGATQYMNGLISAVSHGKITLQDLSVAMGPIDPIAQHLGISFADVAAAMTTQTNAMIPAARAATGLRFMMSALENPTHKASAEMAKLGLDSVAVANEMKVSLPGALEMIVQAALKVGPQGSVPFNRAVGDMVGGIRGLSAFMALTGTHMKDFVANSKAVTDAMIKGGNQVNGWALAQTNFNVIWDKTKAAVAAAAISFGLLLLPALGRIVAVIPQLVDYVSNFSQHANVLVPIIAGLGAIILAVLVPAVWSLAAGVIAATWPVLAIGVAVAGLVAIFMHLYQTNAGFKVFIDNLVKGLEHVWSLIQANFLPTLQRLASWITGTMIPALANLANWLYVNVGGAFSALGTFATNARNAIGGFFSTVGTMANTARTAIGNFFSLIGTIGHDALVTLQNFGSWIAGVFLPDWKDMTGATGQLGSAFSGIGAALQNLWQSLRPVGDATSQLGTTMRQLGSFLASQYGPAFSQLGTVMKQLGQSVLPALKVAWDSVWKAIQPLLPQLKLLAEIIGGIVVAALVLFISLLAGLVMAFAQVLVGLVKVFSGIVQTISGAIQVVIGIVTFFIDLMTGHFSKLGKDLGVIWNGITTMFRGVWLIIQGLFQASIGAIASLLGTFVHTAISIFQGLANALVGHSIIPDMISAIIGWFAQLPGRAGAWIASMASTVLDKLGGLANSAFTAGANIVSQIASGILNNIGSYIGNAMSAVGTFIHDHLPSSPAKLGPLRDLATQGAHIPDEIAKGIMSGIPKLAPSLNLALAPHYAAPMMAGPSASSGSGSNQPIILQIDGTTFARVVLPHLASGIRRAVGTIST